MGHGIIMAEGDKVMIHSRYSNPDGSAIVVVDIMRIKDGVFEEHWDVIQPEATKDESKSKLPMFGGQFLAVKSQIHSPTRATRSLFRICPNVRLRVRGKGKGCLKPSECPKYL
jgi:hypothetical protein